MKFLGKALPFAVSPALGLGLLMRKKDKPAAAAVGPAPASVNPNDPGAALQLGAPMRLG